MAEYPHDLISVCCVDVSGSAGGVAEENESVVVCSKSAGLSLAAWDPESDPDQKAW